MSEPFEFFDFQRRFSTENRCIRYLFKQRWPNGFACPRCGHHYYSLHSTRNLYQCKKCKYQASVTSGTIFHGTRTPLRKWFWMIYLLTRNKTGCSISYLQQMLQINLYKTAWTMAHKIHHAMQQRESLYKIGSELEMDDSYFGERHVSGKRGRGAAKKVPVLVAVQTRRKKDKTTPVYVKMKVIENMTKKPVEDFVRQSIRPASTIRTDGFKSYLWLEKSDYEFEPLPVIFPREASQKLPWVHIVLGNIKNSIKGVHHGVTRKYLKHYLTEFCYKFNRRYIEKSMFSNLLNTCAHTHTITFAELRA